MWEQGVWLTRLWQTVERLTANTTDILMNHTYTLLFMLTVEPVLAEQLVHQT